MPRSRAAMISILALAACVAAAPGARAAVAHPDRSYDIDSPAADPNLNSLDLYTPDGASPADSRPVVVYVHGGGWRLGDKANQIQKKVSLFTAAGYVFASVNYRLSPTDPTVLAPDRIRFPDHPRDIGEALGWLDAHVAEYGGDPTRMLLIGHSAGAHLVSLVSTDPSYARAYGVEPWQLIGTVSLDTDAFDVADRIAEGGPQAKALFYNTFGTPAENAATNAWVQASPLNFADPLDPRFLLVTQAASPDRIADSTVFASILGQEPAAAVLAVPYDHEGINDAVGGPAGSAGETAAIIDFFSRMVAAAADPTANLAGHPDKRLRTGRKRARVRFRLRADQAGAGFECRLDGSKLKPCTRSERYRVRRGHHSFRYRALSARGRPGETRVFRFRVVVAG